jgi:UPF0755 protein
MKYFNTFYGFLRLLATVAFVLLITLIFYISTPIKTTQTVTLPKGSITNTINYLKSEGYALTRIDTYLLAYFIEGQPKSGTLEIGEGSMNRLDFLNKLTNAKEAIDVITLIPGETLPIFLETIAKKHKFDIKKLEVAYNEFSKYKEAGIIPDTYHIPLDSNETQLMKILIEQSKKKYEELAIEHLKKYDEKDWNRILTIASIVQKEAANKDEMPTVASVVFNRLEKDMALQMDGTLNYGKYSHVKVTPKRIKEDTSKFNTYANLGIPPYPICSVSLDAVKAVLKPKKTNYLYFMRNKATKVHDFTDSYKEHLKNIKKAK